MIGALIGAISIVAAINMTVNPYGAWRSRAFDPIYRRITLERLAIPYMLRIARPHTLLIGSSRVILGMRIEQGERDGVLNAAMSGANLQEIALIVELARRNRDLKRIIWGVEFFAFNSGEDGNPDPATLERIKAPWRRIVPDTLASSEALDRSRELYRRSAQGRARLPAESTQPIPWSAEFIGNKMAALQRESLRPDATVALRQARQFRSWYDGYRLSRDQVKLFREIVERIRAANIELILFVPPTSEYELEIIRQSGLWEQFQAWKAALAQVNPFWDFSGFNRIARADELFIDVMHFRPELGFSIMRRLEKESCDKCGALADEALGEGLYFDRPNVGLTLAEQNSRMANRERADSVYARVAHEVIAERGGRAAGVGE